MNLHIADIFNTTKFIWSMTSTMYNFNGMQLELEMPTLHFGSVSTCQVQAKGRSLSELQCTRNCLPLTAAPQACCTSSTHLTGPRYNNPLAMQPDRGVGTIKGRRRESHTWVPLELINKNSMSLKGFKNKVMTFNLCFLKKIRFFGCF